MLGRVVIKLSGEALSGGASHGFCDKTIDSIAGQLKAALDDGTEIALVVGGGNFWRGRVGKHVMDRVRADQIGMLATVMNAIYMSEAFKRHGIDSKIMTPMPFANMTDIYDKYTALDLMTKGVVTFHAAGLCHPFFSTDSVAALRGAELEVDAVLYTKNGVGGVYDRSPEEDSARVYKSLSYKTAIEKQLQFVDGAALHILVEAGIRSFVFGLAEPNGIVRACQAFETSSKSFGTILNTNVEEEFYVNA